jgi:hypothetical protein
MIFFKLKKLAHFLCLSLFCNFLNAQSPSGISSNLELWLKANSGLTANSSNEITSWQDQSPVNQTATAVNKPIRKENRINFNPTISLNGDTEYFNVNLDGIKNSDYNIFAVVKRSNNNHSNYFLGTNKSSVNEGLHFGYRNNTSLTLDQFGNDISFGVNFFDQPRVSTAIVRGQLDKGTNRLLTELRDGVFKSNANSNGTPLTGNGQGRLGRGFNNQGFEGDIAEVIVYSKTLTAQEVKKIDSYLAIKYGLMLNTAGGGTNGDYITSNGTTIWDASANSGYHNHITIIAKDDTSALHQSKSKSEAFDSVLTLEKPEGVSNDNQAIAIGSNNLSLSFTAANAPANFETTNRIWKMQKTGNIDDVTLSFTIPGNTGNIEDYLLLQSSSSSFTNNVTYSLATNISGDTIEFTGISTSNNTYFTLAIGEVSLSFLPNLILWLKADAGVTTNWSNEVTSWQDQSARKSSTAAVNSPRLSQNAINFNPAVYLPNGDNDYFNVNLDAIKNTDYTIIAVVERDNSNTNSYVLGTRATTLNQGLHFGYRSNGTLTLAQFGNDVNLTVNNFNSPGISPAIISGKLNQNTGRTISELRDATLKNQTLSNTQPLIGNGTGQLGRGFNSTGFEGNIAEVMAYSSALSDVVQSKIMSYLAIKYGLTLDSSGGGTNGDYISSDGTITYWDASANATYHNNVSVIGKDEGFELNQLQSKSENTGSIVTIKKDQNLFLDKTAIAIGTNNQPVNLTELNAPEGYKICSRIWKLQKTSSKNEVVEISFDTESFPSTNFGNYELIIGNNTSFTEASSTVYYPEGNNLNFVISANQENSFFTLREREPLHLLSFTPQNNATEVVLQGSGGSVFDLELEFLGPININSGYIRIYNLADDSLIESISVTNDRLVRLNSNKDKVRISTERRSRLNEQYYVLIDAGAFKDNSNNTFEGIQDKTVWQFNAPKTPPALVYGDLKLWLKADEGVIKDSNNNVTHWNDQSSNYNVVVGINSPKKTENSINFHPAITFDGSSSGFQIANGILGSNTYSDMWVYTVQNVKSLGNTYIFHETMSNNNRLSSHLPWSNGLVYYDFGLWNGLGRVQSSSNVVTLNEPTLWTLATSTSTTTPSGSRKNISKNGLSIASNNINNTSESRTGNNSDFFIGIKDLATPGAYDGEIAEMIIYGSKPTAIEQRKIQSYLAIKYGITLENVDYSLNTTIWKQQENFNHRIIALTRYDEVNFHQKKSKSVHPNSILTIEKNDLENFEAIAFGSNGASTNFIDKNNNTNFLFLDESWYSNVISIGSCFNSPEILCKNSVSMSFTLPEEVENLSDYFVVSDDISPEFDNPKVANTKTPTKTGNTIVFQEVTVIDNHYYTLVKRIPTEIPRGPKQQIFTGNNKTLANLNIIGTAIKWYDSATEGNLLPISTILNNNTTYYASQTINTIESERRLAVTVNKIGEDSQTGNIVSDLITTPLAGTKAKWFSSVSALVALEDATKLSTQTYYVGQQANENITLFSASQNFNFQFLKSDSFGNYFAIDPSNNSLKQLDSNGNITQTIISDLGIVSGMTIDNFGFVYVSDISNNQIKKINTNNGATVIFASGLNEPTALTVDADGNIYVADGGSNGVIKKIDEYGNVAAVLGNGFNYPEAIALDISSNIYIADTFNNAVKKMSPDGNTIHIIGSNFNLPKDLIVDEEGFIYLIDFSKPGEEEPVEINLNGLVLKKMNSNGYIIDYIIGSSSNLNGTFLYNPTAVTLNPNGELIVFDSFNRSQTLKKAIPSTISNRVAVSVTFEPVPEVTSLNPENGSIDFLGSNNLEITFSENVYKDSGFVRIFNNTSSLVEQININSSNIFITDNIVTINPTVDLNFGEQYSVQVDVTALKNSNNRNFAGINNTIVGPRYDTSEWNFTTISITDITWTGAVNNSWENLDNWDLGTIPTITNNITIPLNSVIIASDDIRFNNMDIAYSASLTTLKDITSSGEINIVSTATESGVLIAKNSTSVKINYKRGGLLANKWSLVSPILQNQLIVPFAQNASNNIRVNTAANPDRYAIGYYESLNSAGNRWQYFNENTDNSAAFEIGTGYTVSRATDGAVIFTGNLQVDDIQKSVIGNQWNAIGNSFTAYYPLNKNSGSNFLTENASKLAIPAAYIWDNSQSKYVATTNLITSTEKFLPPGQGFFVRPNANTTLLFDEQKRSTKPSSGAPIFAKSSATTPFIKLSVLGDKTTVNTDIIFSKTATKGFDKNEDIENFNGASFDVNTHLIENSDGKNYTIQSLPFSTIESTIIPIHITAKKDKEIIFSLNTVDFPENIDIYLEDKVTNAFKKLNSVKESSYTVTLQEDVNSIGRFYMHTLAKPLKNSSEKSYSIQLIKKDNNSLSISGIVNQKAAIHIYNTLGKEIFKTTIVGEINNLISLPNVAYGVYVVKIITEKGSAAKKIIIE